MNVCFIVPAAYSLFYGNVFEFPFGGSELRAYTLANKLAENKKIKVSFALFDHGQMREENFKEIKVYAFPYKTGNFYDREMLLSRFIGKIKQRFNKEYKAVTYGKLFPGFFEKASLLVC